MPNQRQTFTSIDTVVTETFRFGYNEQDTNKIGPSCGCVMAKELSRNGCNDLMNHLAEKIGIQ